MRSNGHSKYSRHEMADQFERRWNMPRAFDALNCKHIEFKKPTGSGSLYHYYKGFFSIVLMALVDANYKFIWCDLGIHAGLPDL